MSSTPWYAVVERDFFPSQAQKNMLFAYSYALPLFCRYVGACLHSPLLAGVPQTLEMFVRVPPGGGYAKSISGEVDVFCIEHCNLPLATSTTLKGSYELLATGTPAKTPILVGDDWQTVSLAFTPTKDCPAIIFGPSDTNNIEGEYTYLFFDALNLQQGQGVCNDQGLCIPL